MVRDKATLIRQLIPKSFHFDGYNEVNCRNSRDKPFFTNNVFKIGDYTLTTSFIGKDKISLNYECVCPKGQIIFEPYTLSLSDFIDKLHQASKTDSDFITFEIPVKVLSDNIKCDNCTFKNKDCVHIMKSSSQNVVLAAVSFNSEDIKEALAYYFEILSKNADVIKGGKIMNTKSNFLGANFEFGISKDSNIASTLIGVAIRNEKNGNYIIYDKQKNKLTDIANMKMGDLPILLLPTKNLTAGTLIKQDSKYYFVQKVYNDGTISALEPATGEIKKIMLKESIIPGFNFYTQVIAMDPTSLTNASADENVGKNIMAAICMMSWAGGNSGSEFSLDNISDDSFNGLGQYWPLLMMNMNGDNSFMGNSLATMMILGGSKCDNAMQAVMLSNLLDGNSPLTEMFTGKSENSSGVTTNSVVCSKCGKTFPAGTKFCSSCGEKTMAIEHDSDEVMCENCHEHYPAGTNYCSKCGSKTVPIADTCQKCGAKLMKGASFCQNCGTKVKENKCPKCGTEVEENQSFCHICGENLKSKPAPKSTTGKTTKKKSTAPKTSEKSEEK